MSKKNRLRAQNASRAITKRKLQAMSDDTTVDRPVNVEFRDQLIAHGWRHDSATFLASKSEAEIAANLGPRFLARLRRELRLAACQQPPREETP